MRSALSNVVFYADVSANIDLNELLLKWLFFREKTIGIIAQCI